MEKAHNLIWSVLLAIRLGLDGALNVLRGGSADRNEIYESVCAFDLFSFLCVIANELADRRKAILLFATSCRCHIHLVDGLFKVESHVLYPKPYEYSTEYESNAKKKM